MLNHMFVLSCQKDPRTFKFACVTRSLPYIRIVQQRIARSTSTFNIHRHINRLIRSHPGSNNLTIPPVRARRSLIPPSLPLDRIPRGVWRRALCFAYRDKNKLVREIEKSHPERASSAELDRRIIALSLRQCRLCTTAQTPTRTHATRRWVGEASAAAAAGYG